jgi:hypothetical protein
MNLLVFTCIFPTIYYIQFTVRNPLGGIFVCLEVAEFDVPLTSA